MTVRQTVALLVLITVAVLLINGCATRSNEGLSPLVAELWEQYPSPWNTRSAMMAAEAAKSLLEDHPGDIQLILYYLDRVHVYNPRGVRYELAALLNNIDNEAYKKILQSRLTPNPDIVRQTMQEALDIDSNDPYVLANFAHASLLPPGDGEQGLEYARRAVRMAPRLPFAHYTYAYVLLSTGEREQALIEIEKAVEGDPNDPGYAMMHANLLDMLRRGPDALAILEGYDQLHPGNRMVMSKLVEWYQRSGFDQRALEMERSLAYQHSQHGWAFVELARSYCEQDQLDSVIVNLNRAIDSGFFDYQLLADFTRDSTDAFHAIVRRIDAERAAGGGGSLVENTRSVTVDTTSFTYKYTQVQLRMTTLWRETADERKMQAIERPLNIQAPELHATTIAGEDFNLADEQGNIVLLQFWNSSDEEVIWTNNRLRSLYATRILMYENYKMYAVNVNEDVNEEHRTQYVNSFAANNSILWDVLLADDDASQAYHVNSVPVFFVIDADGVIRYRVDGYQPFIDQILGWQMDEAREGARQESEQYRNMREQMRRSASAAQAN